MSRDFVWCTFFAVFFTGINAEIVYKWNKAKILPQMGLNDWRATSFAITQDKIFLTLVDIGKQGPGNGVVGAFNKSASMSPEVTVFPFQSFYKINEPDLGKIITPMSVRTDECDRLWLLDSAVQNLGGMQMKTNPGIYIFNTNTSQLIRSFNIPSYQRSVASFFVTFVVETHSLEHDCEETFGYFADFNGFHLLTYDFLRNKSDLKSHPFFSPDPLVHTPNEFIFNPHHQDLNGIFGLTLAGHHSPHMVDTLYFHPLAGTHEFKINTQVLKSGGKINYTDVEIFKNKGENAEAGISVYDPDTETIFFSEVNTKKIGGFRLKDFKDPKQATYYRYDLNLQNGFIVDLSVRGSDLWVLVDDKSEITIHKLPISDLIEAFNREMKQSQNSASHSFVNLVVFNVIFLSLYALL